MKNLLRLPIILFSAILLITAGCGTESDTNMGTLEVRMHDKPIDGADEVNVHIERVEINQNGTPDGWTTISTPNQSYDLLSLTNGAYTVLGDTSLPTGTYQQIRLILSQDGHNVVIDGEPRDMMVPSGAETGVKLNVNAEIEDNITYTLLLDFDAARSVVSAGQNNPAVSYLLKPVVSATNEAITGAVSGTVDPAEAEAVVSAIAGTDTVSTTIADPADGTFTLIGLEEGTYDIAVDPRNSAYQSTEQTGVTVTIGETNDIGTLEVTQ